MGKTHKAAAPHFSTLYDWEMDTLAYRHMSLAGRCLLMELRRRYNARNNGQIVMAVREAAELLNCAPNTAWKALLEIEAKGWAFPAKRGSFSTKTDKTASLWRLTNQPVGLGTDTPATKEYMRWQPGMDFGPERKGKEKSRSQNLRPSVSTSATVT